MISTNTTNTSSAVTNSAQANKNSYVVFETIYYDTADTGDAMSTSIKSENDSESDVAPGCDATISSSFISNALPFPSVAHSSNSLTSSGNVPAHKTLTTVKKPGIIFLTQASLNELLSATDINGISNNNNNNNKKNNNNVYSCGGENSTYNKNKAIVASAEEKFDHSVAINDHQQTHNHQHLHQYKNKIHSHVEQESQPIISIDVINNHSITTQNNVKNTNINTNTNQIQSVLMINSSTLASSAGLVTLSTATDGTSSTQSLLTIGQKMGDTHGTLSNSQQVYN